MAQSQNVDVSKAHHICKSDGVKAFLEFPLFCPNSFLVNIDHVAVLAVQFDAVVFRMIKHAPDRRDAASFFFLEPPACRVRQSVSPALSLHDIDIVDTSLMTC